MLQQNFYAQFVEKMLDKDGPSHLNSADRKYYVDEMSALLEERVGLELLPKLNQEQTKTFISLVDNKETTPEQWAKFWYEAVPTFEVDIARILLSFAENFKQ